MVAGRKLGVYPDVHIADGELPGGMGQGGQGLGNSIDIFPHLANFILLLPCKIKECRLFVMEQRMEMGTDPVQPFDVFMIHVNCRGEFLEPARPRNGKPGRRCTSSPSPLP